MRRCTLILVPAFALCVTALADPPATLKEKKTLTDWKTDPVCKTVFHAVLEGLYEDGVSTEAVDNVIGKTKDAASEIKHTFVLECPLCHPVYEAFRVYQQRPVFRDKGDTFGKGLEPDLERQLRSSALRTRQNALQILVRRWVERRLDAMALSADQKAHWGTRLQELSSQGDLHLAKLRVADPWYKAWGYGFCAACKGCTEVCNTLKSDAKK